MTRRKRTYAGGDPRTKAARARGYPARSVFKLEEIDRRLGLLERGQRVLDLGAAPGSWSMYASERVGQSGRVVAVDIQEIRQALGGNVTVLRGDALELAGTASSLDPVAAGGAAAGGAESSGSELGTFGPFDVVLSDMAPSTSGSKVRDQALSYELFCRALEIAARCAKPGSSFVGKLFMGPDFEAVRSLVRAAYARATVIRPAGTRRQSSEVFLVGLGRR